MPIVYREGVWSPISSSSLSVNTQEGVLVVYQEGVLVVYREGVLSPISSSSLSVNTLLDARASSLAAFGVAPRTGEDWWSHRTRATAMLINCLASISPSVMRSPEEKNEEKGWG